MAGFEPNYEGKTCAVTDRRNVVEQKPPPEIGVAQTPENSTTPTALPIWRMS